MTIFTHSPPAARFVGKTHAGGLYWFRRMIAASGCARFTLTRIAETSSLTP